MVGTRLVLMPCSDANDVKLIVSRARRTVYVVDRQMPQPCGAVMAARGFVTLLESLKMRVFQLETFPTTFEKFKTVTQ